MNPADGDPRALSTLIAIMAALRTPGTGCPWDLEQDYDSIAPYTIEEAYEVADAIARRDMANLREELGDLLLQVVYHSQMASEEDRFDFSDVVEAISTKMVRRHPHVFGDEAARKAPLAKGFWEKAKAAEKAAKGTRAESVLDGVPVGLPALTRAVKLQAKAARVRFDWPATDHVLDKVAEEAAELREAHLSCDKARAADELGDLMFVLANLARHLGIDPESALRGTNAKFERRFKFVEQRLSERGKKPEQSDLAEMDALWDEAKAAERQG